MIYSRESESESVPEPESVPKPESVPEPEPELVPELPPSLPLPPPPIYHLSILLLPLPVSPSAPQTTFGEVGSPWVCQPTAPAWSVDPRSPPPTSATRTRPINPSAQPWLLPPSAPTWPISSLVSSCSLIPPGSTLVAHQPTLASGLHSSGYASSLRPPGSIGLLTPFCSSLVLTPSVSPVPPPAPQSPEPAASPCPAGSSTWPGLVGSLAPP
ncbi:hypothetical protein PO909_002744 [Leuciscus waleckii]